MKTRTEFSSADDMVRFAGQGFDAVAARELLRGTYSVGTRYQVTFFMEEVKKWC
jgi:hypothetical protein